MRWEDERYIRFYTRDLPEWCVLSWQARGLFGLMLRAMDRAGIIACGKLGLRAVAVLVRAPWEEIEKPLQELLADGCIAFHEGLKVVVAPNFIPAQEARASDRARQKASRERARDIARAMSLGVMGASQPVTNGHAMSDQSVTEDHTRSQEVTPSRAVPSLAVPSRAVHGGENGSAPSLPAYAPRLPAPLPPTAFADPAPLLAAEIRRHREFASLDAVAIADAYAGRLMVRPQKIEDVIAAIDECAAAHTGLPLTAQALQQRLVSFMRHAGRRTEAKEPVEASKVIESKADNPEELARVRAAKERQRAKAEEERKRREAAKESKP